MNSCPYADRNNMDYSIRCTALKAKHAKWDLCIHQYLCRTHGKYKLNDNAQNCAIRKEGT